jgi:hypothetical protein
MGVSLSPIVRDFVFSRNKSIASIGPVYTATQILPSGSREIWKDISQIPAMQEIPFIGEAFRRTLHAVGGRELDPLPTPSWARSLGPVDQPPL